MSKIQKALDLLRENRENAGRPADRHAAGAAAATTPGSPDRAPDRPPMRIRRPLDHDSARAAEALPTEILPVSVDELVEWGLYPAAEHIDRISQEFRRIKRPVINLALGEGRPEAENANMVMMASALPRSGKTWCSINLAASIARERDVGAVLVDADVLKPNISRALGLEGRVGLIDHLLDPAVSIDEIIIPTDFHNIVIIPAGQQHDEATELLASRRMERFVATLSNRFRSRLVVVDTPPLLLTNEARELAEHMGQIVLVIEAGVSTQESVLQAIGSLNKTKPINAILNKARGEFFGDYGGGSYGYYSVPQQGYGYEK